MVKSITELPTTNIKPNKDNPDSAYKILLLLSASATRQELVIPGAYEIRIYRTQESKGSNAYVASLRLNDFELNEVEAAILAIPQKFTDMCSLDAKISLTLNDLYEKLPKYKLLLRKSIRDSKKKHLESELLFSSSNIGNGAVGRTIEARKSLQYLPRESAAEFLTEFEGVLGKYENLYLRMDDVFKKHPDIYSFPIGWIMVETSVGAGIRQVLSAIKSLRDEAHKIRGTLATYEPNPKPVEYLPNHVNAKNVDGRLLEN